MSQETQTLSLEGYTPPSNGCEQHAHPGHPPLVPFLHPQGRQGLAQDHPHELWHRRRPREQTSPDLPAAHHLCAHHAPRALQSSRGLGLDASLPGAAGWTLGSDRSTRTDGYDGCSQSENDEETRLCGRSLQTHRAAPCGAYPSGALSLPLSGRGAKTRRLDAEPGSGSAVPSPALWGPLQGAGHILTM